MMPKTLLFRQIHPGWIQNNRVTSHAFRPTLKDNGLLSDYDGDLITPEASGRHFNTVLVLDCKNKRYSRQAIWAAGAARARSIPAEGCDERATKPAARRANGYIAYFCNQALGFTSSGVYALSVEECAALDLPARSDPTAFAEHAVIDFTGVGSSAGDKKAKILRNQAEVRGWLFQPAGA